MGRDLKPIIVQLDKNPACKICGNYPSEDRSDKCKHCYWNEQRIIAANSQYAYYAQPIDPEGRKYVRPKKRATG